MFLSPIHHTAKTKTKIFNSHFQLLHHENLIDLIETFQGRKGLYLVFEFMEYTLLDEVSRYLGLSENICRRILWQILRGVEFCHLHNVSEKQQQKFLVVSLVFIYVLCRDPSQPVFNLPFYLYSNHTDSMTHEHSLLLKNHTKKKSWPSCFVME